MNMLFVPKPLFNADMNVEAYYFSYNYGNAIVESARGNPLDKSAQSPFFDLLNDVGLETLTMNRPIFVPVSNILIVTDLERVCKTDPSKVVFLLDKDVILDKSVYERIKYYKQLGFKIALWNKYEPAAQTAFLELADYFFIDKDNPKCVTDSVYISTYFKNVVMIGANLPSMEDFETLKRTRIKLFDGAFYKIQDATKKSVLLAPLKIHYIQLINIVSQDDFDFQPFARVVQQDPALAVRFLRLVNSSGKDKRKINSVAQAAAMLGQREIRKWTTTAIASSLNTDKPDEISRVSMLRARFCENLAPYFELALQSENVFLMGLFSVLDVILDMPIVEALSLVFVPDKIRQVLLDHTGQYSGVYDFIQRYDMGDWREVSRAALMNNISIPDIHNAYVESLEWYKNLLILSAAESDTPTIS